MIVDDPETNAEVEAAFAAYERALDDQRRRGARRLLSRGADLRCVTAEARTSTAIAAIQAFRAARSPVGLARTLGADADHDLWARSRDRGDAVPARLRAGQDRPADADLGALSARLADRRGACQRDRRTQIVAAVEVDRGAAKLLVRLFGVEERRNPTRGQRPQPQTSQFMSETIPIIDLAPLINETDAALARVAAEIGAACRGVGFFYVVNHGVPASLVADAFAKSRAFFASPVAEKLENSMDVVGGNRGYSGFMRESLDPGARPRQEGGVQHRPRTRARRSRPVGRRALSGAERLAEDAGFPRRPSWPISTPASNSASASIAPSRAISASISISSSTSCSGRSRRLRLLRYPPEPVGEIGAGTHTDYGNITLLATDGVGGLEVRTRAGDWLAAPSIPGAFVVNIGDCLMRWTNDVYVSTPHRVVSRGAGERYSIAFFLDPNPFAEVEAIPSCIAPGEKPKYPPILAHEYLRSRLEATYSADVMSDGREIRRPRACSPKIAWRRGQCRTIEQPAWISSSCKSLGGAAKFLN